MTRADQLISLRLQGTPLAEALTQLDENDPYSQDPGPGGGRQFWHVGADGTRRPMTSAEANRRIGDAHQAVQDNARQQAAPDTPEAAVAQVDQHLKAFSDAQRKHARHGAQDTEPDAEFHVVLRNALQGRPHNAPASARAWQLYSGMKGSGQAVRDLRGAAIAAHGAVTKAMMHRDPEVVRAVRRHVTDHAWRVSMDDDD